VKVEIKGYIIPSAYKRVYDYFGIPATCPKDVTDAIAAANEKGEALEVEISTCFGGDVFSGSEMYTAILGHKGAKRISVTGLAASAASVIAMAGPNEMSPTAMIMVHRVSSSAWGNYHAMDQESEALQNADKAIAAAYVTKSGMEEKDALSMMDKETWITAKQAVDLKLVDRVMFSDQMVAAFDSGMLPKAVVEKTLAMLAERDAGQGGTAQQEPKAPEANADMYMIARAKLNLIERTL
jgi:ATP-dependent Clp protease protease subunit